MLHERCYMIHYFCLIEILFETKCFSALQFVMFKNSKHCNNQTFEISIFSNSTFCNIQTLRTLKLAKRRFNKSIKRLRDENTRTPVIITPPKHKGVITNTKNSANRRNLRQRVPIDRLRMMIPLTTALFVWKIESRPFGCTVLSIKIDLLEHQGRTSARLRPVGPLTTKRGP